VLLLSVVALTSPWQYLPASDVNMGTSGIRQLAGRSHDQAPAQQPLLAVPPRCQGRHEHESYTGDRTKEALGALCRQPGALSRTASCAAWGPSKPRPRRLAAASQVQWVQTGLLNPADQPHQQAAMHLEDVVFSCVCCWSRKQSAACVRRVMAGQMCSCQPCLVNALLLQTCLAAADQGM